MEQRIEQLEHQVAELNLELVRLHNFCNRLMNQLVDIRNQRSVVVGPPVQAEYCQIRAEKPYE